MKKLLFVAVSIASLIVPSGWSAVHAAPAGFVNQLLINNLTEPTDIAFVTDPTSPNAGMFITQKSGTVLLVENNQLLSPPALTLPSISTGGDRGLLSIALDPNFPSNHFLYLLYTTAANHQRISRFTISGNTIDPASERVLLENPEAWGGFLNAGALRFGPDGKLYASMGSNGEGATAQDLSSLDGKFLRINSDGTIPADNPFVATPGAQPAIYSSGFRNPWRFNFGPDGKAIIGDVGEVTWEKVVRAQPGANYGWPTFEGDCRPNCNGITPPLFVIPHNGQGTAVVGGDFVTGSGFPQNYSGNYFFGDYVQGYLKNVVLDSNGSVSQIQSFDTGDGALSAIDMGPDGCLYYLDIYPGELHKMCAAGTGNTASAVATSDVNSGNLPLTVHFSGVQSTDTSGHTLNYSWNFGNGGTSTSSAPVFTYTQKGIYNVSLTVSDSIGLTSTANLTIWAGYLPPSITISSPVNGAKYNAGNTINFSGSATDPQDGALPANDLLWTVIFHHNTHIHSPTNFPGAGGTFTIPTTGESSDNTWYEFKLTAMDSAGLSAATSTFIFPNKSTMTFAANPSGLQTTIDGQPFATPFSMVGVVGFQRTIGAPGPQTLNGTNYAFSSWSDGGAQTHTIVTPATNTTFTAAFTATTSTSATFVLSANPGATAYNPNDPATITTTATASQNASNLLLDTELWGSGKLLQNVVSPVNFTANTPFNSTWNLAAPGTAGSYSIKTGVFSSDWSKLYAWNDAAGTFTVGSNASGSTSTVPLAFVDSAKFDKTTYSPSSPFTATSTVRANQNLSGVILDTEVYNTGGTKVAQNFVSANLTANQDFASLWQSTVPSAAGTYNVKLAVFNSNWSKVYLWDDAAASFTVASAATSAPSFVVSASMPSSSFPSGAMTSETTKVTATQDVPNVAVDTEIYDSNSTKVGQNAVNTSLLANQQFTANWNNLQLPNATGTYTVKVGVFSSDYSKLYIWLNRAFQFSIGTPPGPPQPGQTYPVTVIQPQDGSTVSGVTEIRAAIQGLDINTYNIGWRTGGTGSFNPLDTDPVTQSFKHTWIDFSTWTWAANHTYPIEFRATDMNSNIIGSTTISVVH